MAGRSLLLALGLLAPLPVAAQWRTGPELLGYQPSPAGEAPATSRSPSAAVSVVASMMLPGAGQWLEGQRRWVPYMALELWSWARFAERRRESRQLTARYRDLAWRVARRVGVGERRDTVFEYYEAMAQWSSSGAWDLAPGLDGLQPETDVNTFNGQVWALSRGLFFPGGRDYAPGTPEYQAALGYYRGHAVPDHYRWAWGASNLEQQVYSDLISASDEAYRHGTRMLGVILANHIASAVDALITARLRALASSRVELRSDVLPEGGGTRLQAQLHVAF